MKKSTLIRSEKPHAVKVEEGSSVAQRKGQKKSAPLAAEVIIDNLQKVPTSQSKRSASVRIEPTLSPAPVKAQPPSKRTAPSAVKAVKKISEKTPNKTKVQSHHAEQPVWEKDNPIKHRIEALKIRNAELAEQIQRLLSTQPTRGQQP